MGAPKCGTSDLSVYLLEHPNILLPLSKDIGSAHPGVWSPYFPTEREKQRAEAEGGIALAGLFNTMLHSMPLMDSLAAVRPDAKVILMLRNPVDRAFSQYKWEVATCRARIARLAYYASFGDYVRTALDLFPAVLMPAASGDQMLQTGIYSKAVQLWIDRFGRDQVLIVGAEDFFADSAAVLSAVHRFLGLPDLQPTPHKEVINRNPVSVPPIEPETRRDLQSFYRPWNEMLYEVVGRDFGWDPPDYATAGRQRDTNGLVAAGCSVPV
jgi:hypothetical protein